MFIGFNGTSISVYGAKRANHGQYNVTVDKSTPTTASGASDTETFQQLLYSSGDLRPDFHNLTLLNVDGKFLDVDYVSGYLRLPLPVFSNASIRSLLRRMLAGMTRT